MPTEAARAAGIRPNLDDDAPTSGEAETAEVDLLIHTECEVDADGVTTMQRSVVVAAGDPIPAELAHLPRIARATGRPITG